MKKLATFLTAVLVLACSGTYAATYTVSNTNNSGSGSLRQAIIDANTNSGADVINFSTSGTITLTTLLPFITGPVSINGYTATGAAQGAIGSRTIAITINGGNQTSTTGTGRGSGSSNADGLFRFTSGASSSSISGLSIINTGSSVEAVMIEPGCANIHIWGNYIGVNASGVASSSTYLRDDAVFIGDYGNSIPGAVANIYIGTDGNGTNDANEGNVLSNAGTTEGGDGVQIGYKNKRIASISNIRISGNYIGLAADGTTIASNGTTSASDANANGFDGVFIDNIAGSGIIIGTDGNGTSDVLERNIISGNAGNGIEIGSSEGIAIAGNYIGTDKAGTAARPNGKKVVTDGTYAGIALNVDANISGTKNPTQNIIIGFNDATHSSTVAGNVRNVISGNQSVGIDIYGTPTSGQNNTIKIAGNYIGVDVTGNTRLGNGQGATETSLAGGGIQVGNATGIIIGTDGDGTSDVLERNVISGARLGRGVVIYGSSTNSNVSGNYIGVGADGATPIGNDGPGVSVDVSTNIRIGSDDNGTSDGLEANVIANNAHGFPTTGTSDGVRVTGNATQIRISRNAFYNNGFTPIDLVNDGVSVNDGNTTSGQPNILLDYPVFTGYKISGTTMTVSGYVGACNGGNENTAGTTISGTKTIQIYKVADDGDQNGAISNGGCSRSVPHGEGVQYLGSISISGGTFTSQSFTLVAGASFAPGDKITGITIDANSNTSEFGVVAENNSLPITFGTVSAYISGDQLLVNFASLIETNNSHFEIEASTDGTNFTKIGEVVSKANDGNSASAISYDFATSANGLALGGLAMLGLALGAGFARRKKLMIALMAASIIVLGYSCTKNEKVVVEGRDNLFVRIAQVDKDGTKSYSKVIKVEKK